MFRVKALAHESGRKTVWKFQTGHSAEAAFLSPKVHWSAGKLPEPVFVLSEAVSSFPWCHHQGHKLQTLRT